MRLLGMYVFTYIEGKRFAVLAIHYNVRFQ